MIHTASNGLARTLGYAGLLPFAAGALVAAFGGAGSPPVLWVVAYGAIIASFMAGGLWVRSLAADDPVGTLLAIGVALGVWVALLPVLSMSSVGWRGLSAIISAVGLVALFVFEARAAIWPEWYARLRRHLTIGASLSFAVIAVASIF